MLIINKNCKDTFWEAIGEESKVDEVVRNT